MRSIRPQELQSALASAGLRPGDVTMVHSALFRLGKIGDAPIQEIPSRIYAALRRQVGPEGTIVVPTFNFEFCRGREFDRNHSPSKSMGAFSEYVRQLPDSRRSPHPIQSLAAIGPLAKDITHRDTAGAFEEDSSFDAVIEYDAKILTIGCGFEAVSLVHWAEEQVGVPYRYWKSFSGPYRDGRWAGHKTYQMYVRDLDLDPEVRLERIGRALRRRGELRRLRLGAGAVTACRARDFAVAALQLLRRDPTALIRPIASDNTEASNAR